MSGYWRVFREDWDNKGTVRSFAKNISMCYYADGTFFYNGSTGTWEVLDDGSIDHKLDANAEDDLNFGGIFSVTELSDSTLTLTKVLTTSHDLKRTLHLQPSTVLTKTTQHDSGAPYFFEGTLSTALVDSLCGMDTDQLFNAGITLLPNNMIHIMTPDTLHVIRPKVPEKRHTRVPLH